MNGDEGGNGARTRTKVETDEGTQMGAGTGAGMVRDASGDGYRDGDLSRNTG